MTTTWQVAAVLEIRLTLFQSGAIFRAGWSAAASAATKENARATDAFSIRDLIITRLAEAAAR